MSRVGCLALFTLLLAACGDNIAGTTPTFTIDNVTTETFYELPFPNDVWRTAAGTLDLEKLPTNAMLVDQIRAAAQELDGFGLNAGIFVRVTGALDLASLPDAAGSITEAASVYLVDVTAGSPDYGKRTPIVVHFRLEGTRTNEGPQLVARPYPGFPLAEGTTYALVVTTRVKAESGDALAVAPRFADVAGTRSDATAVAVRATYAPLFTWLDATGGDERSDVAVATVFTTQHATFVAPALRKGVFALAAPAATDVVSGGSNPTFQLFTGNYVAPNFQSGDVPYVAPPSGRISVDSTGTATVARMEPMRFALTVPAGEVPAAGWPICIYSHGTGGSFTSFVNDGTATSLAREGIAVISTDQVLHGPRNPAGNPELDFFNFGNVYAARDNALQGAADAWSQMRLATGLSITDTGRTHTFDATRVTFFGHSQGGVTGPGFVAFEPSLTGAVLSGTAGLLYENLLHKTAPLDIPSLVDTVLRDSPVDEDNPSLALVQMWIERSDGVNFAPLMVRNPPTVDGTQIAARNIFQTEGFTDTYAPNIGIEAFATALGADIIATPNQTLFEGVTLRGRSIIPAPAANNVNGATNVLGQYKEEPGSDGHFVVFDIALARTHAATFLGSLARTGTATITNE